MSLLKIQQELKAPKGQTNSFGKYKYRSAEDILEAAKPICHKYGYFIILDDEVEEIGGRIYVRAVVAIKNEEEKIAHSATGWAREEENKKGMDASQITGAASSYARKYALNGLFAIDDTKDADATNKHEIQPKNEVKTPKKGQMNDITFLKLVARYNGGEKDVFDKAGEHFEFRHTDLLTIKTLQNDREL
jgi:hypothetical protein